MNTVVREHRLPFLRQGLAMLLAFALIGGLQFFRFVLTPSLPRGVYLALAAGSGTVGNIISFCPPEAIGRELVIRRLVAPGTCPGGSVPLAKRIVAIAPWVCARPEGVRVDALLFPWPTLPPPLGLSRIDVCGPMPKDCLFVLGDSEGSIDSRVFGCIPISALKNRLIPLLTERGPS